MHTLLETQQKLQVMQFPEQTYRWLISLEVIPNQGELTDKNNVIIHHPHTAHFESGYNIALIVSKILKKSGLKQPASLQNIKKDTTKAAKQTNWNFVWLSFDGLRMQFDSRIKDLILQGENALIVEIVKQLCERDEHKDEKSMRDVMVLSKGMSPEKSLHSARGRTSSGSLDIRKLNVQKDPQESESSLQFLVLLLCSSLDMPVEEILGLFTNQNKYLAHLIVKGVNEDYTGIRLFYNLLQKHASKLKAFIEQDLKDAELCLFAIKAGFISKDPRVAELTVKVFLKVGKIYHWLVNEQTKGSSTILLGMKRHPQLADAIWQMMEHIIGDNELNYFISHFKMSFKDQKEMIEVCLLLVRPLSNSFIKQKLDEVGIFAEWLEITAGLFEGGLAEKQLSFNFLCEMMLSLPDVVSSNDGALLIFKKGWRDYRFVEYVELANEMFGVLDRLAENRSKFASRIYQYIIEVFQQISGDMLKKEYLVENFCPIIPQYPTIPSCYFIEGYKGEHIEAIDHELITTAIYNSDDCECLVKIGQVLLKMFTNNAVTNGYMGPNLLTIAQKGYHDEIGQAFIFKAVKNLLHAYGQLQSNKKNILAIKQQPPYFGQKGNASKVNEDEIAEISIREKAAFNIIELVDKLVDLEKSEDFQFQLKNQILQTNSVLKKSNFNMHNKALFSILRKFGITKQEENEHEESLRMKKSMKIEEQLKKRSGNMTISRVSTGPAHLKREFAGIVEKRKRQEEEKKEQEERKKKEKMQKQFLFRKEIEKQKLLRGFGSGETGLKEEGFWSKLIKEDKQKDQQIQLYMPSLMEQRDLDGIDVILKKFHRIVRHLFLKYTSSMHSIKSVNNFDENQARKQTITLVEVVKFLKDYKLFFLTSNHEIQSLVREINVKLLNKRETLQELDFHGFEQFLIQFSAIIYTKPHSINAKVNGVSSVISRNYIHISHSQLLEEVFRYLKMVFQEKGEKTSMFDEPQAAYFNESEVIKEFNRKIHEDPGFILPEGYKKIVEKTILEKPELTEFNRLNFSEAYCDVLGVLDEIIFESQLKFHIVEPMTQKAVTTRVKPHAFTNIRPKLMSENTLGSESRARAMTSVVEKKVHIPPVKMLQRKVLSFGMKLGLSYVNYKDKLLGEQVAYVIDDMLNAIELGRTTIDKQKIQNEAVKKRKEQQQAQKKAKIEREQKRKDRKVELQKQKKEISEKKQKQVEETKEEKEKKKLAALQKEKKKKEEMDKYIAEQRAKLKQKKQKEEEQKQKQKEEKKKKREESVKAKQKFNQYSANLIEKLRKDFEQTKQKKKKSESMIENDKKQKEEMHKKLKQKINSEEHKKFAQIHLKNNQQILQLFESEEMKQTFKAYDINLKAVYEFLIKNTFQPLTGRKHNNEIILETWNLFGVIFELSSCIIESKEMLNIFKSITKDKEARKQFYLGLNYEQFQQALLRIAIKHKSIFNKIAERIKDEKGQEQELENSGEINNKKSQKLDGDDDNEFEEEKEINVKELLVEPDINKEIFDDYGEISKVTPVTLKGLIYYLRVPKDRLGQERRFRSILNNSKINHNERHEILRTKLKETYTLRSPRLKKKKVEAKKTEGQNNENMEGGVEDGKVEQQQ